MPQLTKLAFFHARSGQSRALGIALSALISPTRAEIECLGYDFQQSLDDADVWLVYENRCSSDGLEAQMLGPHLQAFLKVVPDLIAVNIDLRRFSMISTPTPRI